MDEKPKITAPGLIWQPRAKSWTPYWRSPKRKGEKQQRTNLSYLREKPEELIARCNVLENEYQLSLTVKERSIATFDGTVGSLLRKYQTDPGSSYFELRPGSRHPYDHYIGKLIDTIGEKRLDKITGIDLKRWHETWSANGEHLAASKMARCVLDAAVSYGIMTRISSCIELREVLKVTGRKLPSPRRRDKVVTADQVVALRAAAHADGRRSCALVYALVFETTLRLWDVIGQWWPIDSHVISDIAHPRYGKWAGLRWEDIDPGLVLRFVPSKTSAKTGIAVTFPLSLAPMAMEELEHWPAEKRTGPVIVAEGTGRPYKTIPFTKFWRRDRKAAGIDASVWARDLRASGITEARAAGVSTDDAGKVAGHSSTKTTATVYDRAVLEAAERFAEARTKKRAVK